jgi:HEAT repeat protein
MTPGQVADAVKRKNFDLMLKPEVIGSDAGPALLPLLDNPDPQVRELAVNSLNYAGGPAARQGFLKELNDRVETIRSAAARYLRKHYSPEDIPTIRREAEQSRDEYVRQQLALLLGETGDPANIPLLQRRIPVEPDEHARRAVSLALARLGDPVSRQQLTGRLAQDDPAARVAAARDLPYVHDTALLVHLLPLLDDTREGLNVGYSHGPFYKRVCDVAADVANEMLGDPFPWVQRIKRYSDQEIAQVKAAIAAIQKQ